MKKVRLTNKNDKVRHKIIDFISSIEEKFYNHEYYSLRHPGGIYNIVFAEVIEGINNLLEGIEKEENHINIKGTLRLLIYDLFKFYESSYEIILSLCKSHNPKPQNRDFLSKWIRNEGYNAGQILFDKTKDDLGYFRYLYNKLKHSSNVVRTGFVANNNYISYYYWLEVPTEQGGVAPASDYTFPISFFREIRRIYYFVYKISEILMGVLEDHMREIHDVEIIIREFQDSGKDITYSIYERIKDLSRFFAKQEVGDIYYSPKISEGEMRYLTFTTDKITSNMLESYYRKISGNSTTKGDGFTKKFCIPTMCGKL